LGNSPAALGSPVVPPTGPLVLKLLLLSHETKVTKMKRENKILSMLPLTWNLNHKTRFYYVSKAFDFYAISKTLEKSNA
jgi:hypothetical protein